MLDRLDAALEQLLQNEVPLPTTDFDVSFAWPGGLTQPSMLRPTVNLFLWDANENVRFSVSGIQTLRTEDGTVMRKAPDPFLDVRYLMTAWCERERDEHRLLGRLMAFLMARPSVPLSVGVDTEPTKATIRLERPEARRLDSVWQGMEGRLRPAVDVVVTIQVNVSEWTAAAPVAREVGTRLGVRDADRA